MSNFDPSQIGEMVTNAPEAGFAPINYGKLSVVAQVLAWKQDPDDEKKRNPVRSELQKGQKLGKGEILELKFSVDVSEFNPALEFQYERTISVRKTSAREKTDWTEIVEPSLLAVFGKEWIKAVAKHPYVEVEDVPNVLGKVSGKSGKTFGVPKFLRIFASAAEAKKAREDRFGAAGEAAANVLPPDQTIGQVKSLIDSVGEETALEMLSSRPFGNFDPQVLVEMAKKK